MHLNSSVLPSLLAICLSFVLFCSSLAQTTRLDSIESIQQTTFEYTEGIGKMTIRKISLYDTNQVLIEQNRYNYIKVDTGYLPITHYYFEYKPNSRKGSYYNENFPHPGKPKRSYSKQITKFKNFDHTNKRIWASRYKKNSQSSIEKQTRNKYDSNGNLVDIEVTEYKKYGTTKHTEKMQRNAAGNILQWQSFDDDGDREVQARNFVATYKEDTLLLKSTGYLYFNWNQTTNKYNRKRELTKSIQLVGNRAPNGKVSFLDKNTTIYKSAKPYKRIEKKLNKKVKTISYSYTDSQEIQLVTTPSTSYQETKSFAYTDSLNLLTKYTETQEGKPFLEIHIDYDSLFRMSKHTEIEFRQNDKDWKTVKTYNELGNLVTKRFFIAGQIRREDVYNYRYFKQNPKIIEQKNSKN